VLSDLTGSPSLVPASELAQPEVAEVASSDGEPVPLFVFRPLSGEEHPPVVVMVHGGPEPEAVLSFNPVVQGLVTA